MNILEGIHRLRYVCDKNKRPDPDEFARGYMAALDALENAINTGEIVTDIYGKRQPVNSNFIL